MRKIWLKIGEMAEISGVDPKELRYWEKVIPDLCPRRSKGNLRYYHVDDLNRLLSIKRWLSEGYSVSDCRKMLRGGDIQPRLIVEDQPAHDHDPRPAGIAWVLDSLRSLRDRLAAGPQSYSAHRTEDKAPSSREEESVLATAGIQRPPSHAVKPRARRGDLRGETRGKMWSMLRLPMDWED